ncbi:hypothetical protein ACG7TL_006323 [Trametes sanguinea]
MSSQRDYETTSNQLKTTDDRFDRRTSSSPGTPSHSPPPSREGPSKTDTSPANSDDSSLWDLSELSFVYERNSRGEIVRVSKGSSKSSTPPTPSGSPPKVPSPTPAPTHTRPAPLARSESLPQESLYAPRQFQRVASGPIATPVGMARGFSALATTTTGTGRKLGGPRRVKLEDLPEGDALPKPNMQTGMTMDEKENLRAARIIRPARSVVGIDRISEAHEEHEPPALPMPTLPVHHPIRPRRSASLSDAPPPIDPVMERPLGHIRAGTSLGARRVTLEEKIRQEREIALEEGVLQGTLVVKQRKPPRLRRQQQRQDEDMYQHPRLHRKPPSHRMRTCVTSGEILILRSPTLVEAPVANQGQWATAPEEQHKQLQREQSHPQAQTQPQPQQAPPPTKASQAATTFAAANGRTLWHTDEERRIQVNKKQYARLDMIGKGGSSRVFRVMNQANEIYAIKRVALDKVDAETMAGYMNEIGLLKRLDGNARIIRLFDSEVKQQTQGSKGYLLLVMECGEIDLAKLLQEQQKEPMDPVWIAYYWKQMLQAVHVIHEEKIVHSDLKPANFVLVRGQLKLIDFGIANAIANDTTNIQRDHQIGTVNYMSPEAIELPDGMRRLKVGRPSDVWSLGCILYQMVYGQPPFQALSVYQKMKAIPDEDHVIEFPEYAVPVAPRRKDTPPTGSPPQRMEHLKVRVPQSIINTMKSCLVRNPKARATIPELLQQNWLEPEIPSGPASVPESPRQPAPELCLRPDETIINPHYMLQLLQYGMTLGRNNPHMDFAELEEQAKRLVGELQAVNGGPR